MPNYEDFKKYAEWSKKEPGSSSPPPPSPERKSLLKRLVKPLRSPHSPKKG